MPRSLLLLVGSARPGAYINTLAYAVDQLEVDRIVMVNILYAPFSNSSDFEELVDEKLRGALLGLSKGAYRSMAIPAEWVELYKDLYVKYSYRHTERINYHFF
ncbi:hypothetical protein [Thermogemmatispora onikobensis]|uniref:hypothetical protein n=1 Tax=Thermogemmatispora onikobensis TaxID=732234 RepID=UPI00114CDB77|nr:hypothetical protein [Thermogemmatispora onikobensis]